MITKNMYLILIATTTILLLFLIQSAYSVEKFRGLPFSIEVPDSWTYTETPEPPIEHVLGVSSYSSVVLVPAKFAELLIQDKGDIGMGNGTAAIVFAEDSDYTVKNAPPDLYVKFRMNKDDSLNVTSRQDTMVGKEKAVRIEGSKNDTSGSIRLLEYLIFHNNEPYIIRYIASMNDFERYLPDFELMVKSFKFGTNATRSE
ncbi:MAG: hypothetical protein E6K97_06560 [Thaumarchaeota archaeon]|nr:MAG: hypothetical protein E6K97_06560 [Nitrososphaerota archaeon]